MPSRYGCPELVFGALILVAVVLVAGAYWYASPPPPNIPRRNYSHVPESSYEPGGSQCRLKQIATLPVNEQAAERTRCSEARNEHRVQQYALQEQRRANDIAEWNLGLATRQAHYGLAQTAATIAAFIAAAVASGIAWRAMVWAKHAAKETKRSADAAHDQLEAAKTAERGYIATDTDLRMNGAGGIPFIAGNTGRTYCNVIALHYSVRPSLPAKPDISRLRMAKKISDIDVAAGQQGPIATIPGPIPAIAKHIVGYVRYVDVYRATHRQYFRYDRTNDRAWETAGGGAWNSRQPE
jgi:hypothetical protein